MFVVCVTFALAERGREIERQICPSMKIVYFSFTLQNRPKLMAKRKSKNQTTTTTSSNDYVMSNVMISIDIEANFSHGLYSFVFIDTCDLNWHFSECSIHCSLFATSATKMLNKMLKSPLKHVTQTTSRLDRLHK